MKQQDLAVIMVIVFMAGIFSFFLTSKFITPSNSKLSAEVVSAIESDFPEPSDTVFNSTAINPTVNITINPNANNQPFTNQDQ